MTKAELLATGVAFGGALGMASGYSWGAARRMIFRQHHYRDAGAGYGVVCENCGRSKDWSDAHQYQPCQPRPRKDKYPNG